MINIINWLREEGGINCFEVMRFGFIFGAHLDLPLFVVNISQSQYLRKA